MFDSLQMRAVGEQSIAMRAFMAQKLEEFARRLLIRGLDAWASEDFHRFAPDDENSCSVRLYDLCDEILRVEEIDWPQVQIRYEGFLPTFEMRKGSVSVAGASRPDLFISVGSAEVLIEAKRLKPSGDLPRLYIVEGMKRFISGRYPVSGQRPGLMLGYVMNVGYRDTLGAVNAAIERIEWLTQNDALHVLSEIDERTTELDSRHVDDVHLIHFWVSLG